MTSVRLWAGHQPLTPSPNTYKRTADMGVNLSTYQLSSAWKLTPLQPGLSHDVEFTCISSVTIQQGAHMRKESYK